jgi:hypothetical protein
MPLSSTSKKVLQNMKDEYGSKKGESIFYATANKKGSPAEDAETWRARKKAASHAMAVVLCTAAGLEKKAEGEQTAWGAVADPYIQMAKNLYSGYTDAPGAATAPAAPAAGAPAAPAADPAAGATAGAADPDAPQAAQGGFWEQLKPYLPYIGVGGLGSLLLGSEETPWWQRLLTGVLAGGLGSYGYENYLRPHLPEWAPSLVGAAPTAAPGGPKGQAKNIAQDAAKAVASTTASEAAGPTRTRTLTDTQVQDDVGRVMDRAQNSVVGRNIAQNLPGGSVDSRLYTRTTPFDGNSKSIARANAVQAAKEPISPYISAAKPARNIVMRAADSADKSLASGIRQAIAPRQGQATTRTTRKQPQVRQPVQPTPGKGMVETPMWQRVASTGLNAILNPLGFLMGQTAKRPITPAGIQSMVGAAGAANVPTPVFTPTPGMTPQQEVAARRSWISGLTPSQRRDALNRRLQNVH